MKVSSPNRDPAAARGSPRPRELRWAPMAEPTPAARRAASWKSWLLAAVGPGVLCVILLSLDRSALLAALSRAEPEPLLAAYLVPLPAIALRTWRWRLLLGEHGGSWRFGALLALYARAIALGVATPGRVGEVAKALPVARRGAGYGPALATVVADRLADLAFLVALAVPAVPLLLGSRGEIAGWALLGVLAGGGAAVFGLARAGGLARWAPAVAPQPRVGAAAAAACALLTVASWAITCLASWLYARSLGLPIGYLEMASLAALCSIVGSLPISIAGAGTRDATLLLALGPLGATRPEAVALSTLMLSNVLFVGGVCALALFVGREPTAGATDRT